MHPFWWQADELREEDQGMRYGTSVRMKHQAVESFWQKTEVDNGVKREKTEKRGSSKMHVSYFVLFYFIFLYGLSEARMWRMLNYNIPFNNDDWCFGFLLKTLVNPFLKMLLVI